ncbi:MAG: hypothetical protein DRG59_03970 [Deltaproteobacteria bacterium]|nr:MAG: hypothetical protein DRG83_10990 [Deltaproteobacteria bacterium]RLB08848.1 MAG: hypothetical protein DRG59_03970 [Deltaproteobacteria bacterium]
MAESQKCLDLRHGNTHFKDEVTQAAGGETLTRCFACGICTGCCPVSEIDNRFRPSSIIQMILLGQKEDLLKSDIIWYCWQCFSCSFHCPQGVKFASIIRVLRYMAVDEGIVSPELMEKVSEIDMSIRHARRKILDFFFDEYRRKGKVPDNIEGLCKKSFGDK